MKRTIVLVCSVAILLFAWSRRPLSFERAVWIAAGPQTPAGTAVAVGTRWRMLDDLMARHVMLGASFAELCDILGPDDTGNCENFHPFKAGTKRSAPPPEMLADLMEQGRPTPSVPTIFDPNLRERIEDPRPGPPCERDKSESGIVSGFGGLAPHFKYRIRNNHGILRTLHTDLYFIFCEEGVVDQWLLQIGD